MNADTAFVAYIRGLRLQRERAYAREYVHWWLSDDLRGIRPYIPQTMSDVRARLIRRKIERLLAPEVKA